MSGRKVSTGVVARVCGICHMTARRWAHELRAAGSQLVERTATGRWLLDLEAAKARFAENSTRRVDSGE